jgi:hypothetical protein
MLPFGRRWQIAGLLALLLAGCQQVAAPHPGDSQTPPEATPQQKQLATSLETWNALKTENGDHYRYETRSVSWTGFRSTTTLTVRSGEVVIRAYESHYQNDAGEGVSESWTEEDAAVGSHESGADPVTIDALYSECRTEVLTKNPQDNVFYLDFHQSGVLKTCEYRPLACADDCLFGVSVDALEFLESNQAKPTIRRLW